MTHAGEARAFDAIWPREPQPFLDMLQSPTLLGAEDSHAVTKIAVVLARSFAKVVDGLECAGLLRDLLATASGVPLDPSWARAFVVAVLDETAGLPGLSDVVAAKIGAIKAMHLADAASPEWRSVRMGTLSLADAAADGFDKKALEIAGALAWPSQVAVKSIGDILSLLCEARVDVMADEANFVFTPNDQIMALYQPIFDENSDAEAEGRKPRPPKEIFAERHPALTVRLEEERVFYHAALHLVGRRLLMAGASR